MCDCDNDDVVSVAREDDAVGEPAEQKLPRARIRGAHRPGMRTSGDERETAQDFLEQRAPEPALCCSYQSSAVFKSAAAAG